MYVYFYICVYTLAWLMSELVHNIKVRMVLGDER